ncbi:MAG: nucleotidyltransferase family protein, partial [Pyrinomonadaceae bacterium]
QLAAFDLDWKYLLSLAGRHALVPLLYNQLQQHASELVPPGTMRELKHYYQENAARNILLASELVRLISLLEKNDVEAIPYKGPALAVHAYGDLSLRQFVDLDFMVKRDDVLKARNLLLAEGYKSTRALNIEQQALLLRTQHNMQFTNASGRLLLELHWEVASHLFASSVNAADLWRSLGVIHLADKVVKTLSSDDLLFSLCVHGSRHLWERLAWICDVGQIIDNHSVDWPMLVARAELADAERMFFLGLYLADNLLGASLPSQIRARIRQDKVLRSLADRIIDRLFTGSAHIAANSRQIFHYNFFVRKSWRSRVRYFLYMLRPTDRDLSTMALPSRFNFAYYLMRPLRLLQRHP